MPFVASNAVQVKEVRGKGLGVFAARDIASDEVIERCPVLVLSKSDVWQVDSSLSRYVFTWRDDQVALALGYGSLYNHSFEPNARCEDRGRRCKQFVAIREIVEGEEITFNYNGTVDDTSPVGFAVVE